MNRYIRAAIIGVIVGSCVCFVGYKAFAQPAPAPQLIPEITLKVNPEELDIISAGLQTQPFGKVVPLLNKLRQQVIDQQPKPVDAPKVEAPK